MLHHMSVMIVLVCSLLYGINVKHFEFSKMLALPSTFDDNIIKRVNKRTSTLKNFIVIYHVMSIVVCIIKSYVYRELSIGSLYQLHIIKIWWWDKTLAKSTALHEKILVFYI